jgi:hypothetical protein
VVRGRGTRRRIRWRRRDYFASSASKSVRYRAPGREQGGRCDSARGRPTVAAHKLTEGWQPTKANLKLCVSLPGRLRLPARGERCRTPRVSFGLVQTALTRATRGEDAQEKLMAGTGSQPEPARATSPPITTQYTVRGRPFPRATCLGFAAAAVAHEGVKLRRTDGAPSGLLQRGGSFARGRGLGFRRGERRSAELRRCVPRSIPVKAPLTTSPALAASPHPARQ